MIRRRRLIGESLEHRRVLATYLVDTADDSPADFATADGSLSLREAIEAANTNTAVGDAAAGSADGVDTITFAGGLSLINLGGTFELTDAVRILFDGGDDNTLTLDGGGAARHFRVASDNVVIEGLTMTGGRADLGGAIRIEADASLTLRDVTLTGNSASPAEATGGGGAIWNAGTVDISGVTIGNNTSSGSGGGILNAGTLTATDTTIDANAAVRAGGGIESTAGSTTTLTGLTLSDNTVGDAPGNGGGFHITGDGDATITSSTITGNTAGSEGGGLWNGSGEMTIIDTVITDNVASGTDADNGGGGVFNNGGTVDITGGEISGNVAGFDLSATPITASLTGDAEVPPVTTDASGQTTVTYDAAAMTLDVTVTVDGLAVGDDDDSDDDNGREVAGVHIHVGGPDENGPVIIDLGADNFAENGDGTITLTRSDLDLADEFVDDLRFGNLYVNVHTRDNPGGEVRGQLVPDATSASGGGILNAGTLTVTGTTIDGNTASRAGGGVEAIEGTTTTLDGVLLSDNLAGAAPGNGGGLHISGDGDAMIVASEVTGNTAASEGGGLWNGAGEMLITRTVIADNTASGDDADDGGGGVFNNGGIVRIVDSNLADNVADGDSGSGGGILTLGDLFVENAIIDGNTANRAGGGIEAAGGTTTTLTGVTLLNNTVGDAPGNGGGLHITGDGDATITASFVTGNTAGAEGGGLWNGSGTMTVTDTIITGNTASGDDPDNGGGGVFNVGGTVNISGSTIRDNVADGDSGSGGGVLNLGTLTVADTTIAGNTANRAGGGVEAIEGTTTTLTDVHLSDNAVGDAPGNGGGLHITGDGDATITGGTVTGNAAANEGGGLWNGSGTLQVTGTFIADNTASGDDAANGGGGVFNVGGTVNFDDVVIRGNTADGDSGSGGGIHNRGTLTVTNSIIDGNDANRAGGGIESSAGTSTTLTDVLLTGNTTGDAPGNGGGLHITGDGDATIDGSTITDNFASAEGGGVWNGSGTMTITDTTIADNTASGDDADNGGGGVFNESGTVSITDSNITGNLADGDAGSGGGILNQGTLTVTDTSITANTSNRAGGGIESTAGTQTELTGVNLSNNSTGDAPGNGGGLHITGDGDATITDSVVTGNTAGSEGGGLWNGSGEMTVTGTTIAANFASGDDADNGGGGVFNNGGVVTITGSTINANVADGDSGSGGGILNTGTLSVTDTSIDANRSSRAGGGVEVTGGTTTTLTNVTLSGNQTGNAPGNGGGLHITADGDVTVAGSTVNGNTAANEGGGLWNSGVGTLTVTDTDIFGNRAPLGSGVFTVNADDGTSGTTTITGSTIGGEPNDVVGGFVDGGGNTIADDDDDNNGGDGPTNPPLPDDVNFLTPSAIARPYIIPADADPTAVIFMATDDATITVTPVGVVTVDSSIRMLDGDGDDIGGYAGGVFEARVEEGGMYAIVFAAMTTERTYSVSSSAGGDSLSAQPPTNIINPTDVNADGATTPLDALSVLNFMRVDNGEGEFAADRSSRFMDVNRDGNISPLDALVVLNRLRRDSVTTAAEPIDTLATTASDAAIASETATAPIEPDAASVTTFGDSAFVPAIIDAVFTDAADNDDDTTDPIETTIA